MRSAELVTVEPEAEDLFSALDAGAVLSRDARDFAPGTSAGEALTELASFGTDALQRAIEALEKDPAAGEQQTGEASYAHKLERADGRLDLSLPAASVLAHWAGVTPEPGAFVHYDEQPLKILELRATNDDSAAAELDRIAGTVRLASGRAILDLADASLELVRVQPAGKAAMAGADWLRGRGGEAVLS